VGEEIEESDQAIDEPRAEPAIDSICGRSHEHADGEKEKKRREGKQIVNKSSDTATCGRGKEERFAIRRRLHERKLSDPGESINGRPGRGNFFSTLNYSSCNEDWRTERRALQLGPTDRLLVVKVDLGTEQRTICAGIKQWFPDPSVLVGRLVVVVANLAPRPMRGVESNGMILAATGANDVVPLTLLRDVPPGSSVS
jgi:hypothetical protein